MIYIITNKLNGSRYIGKTSKTLEKRWYQHCKNAEYGTDTYLYRAMRKYGVENFTIEPLCEGLNEEEILMIAEHRPEYNMTFGGDGGDMSASPNWQKAMQERCYDGERNPNYGKRGENSPNYGKRRTEEQKERYRQGYKGKRIPVRVDGVDYGSVIEAARALGRSERYVRLHDELNVWKY